MTTLDLITKEDLENFKKEFFEELRNLKMDGADKISKKWLRSSDVRTLLGISPGTLQTLRINGTLRFSKVGNIFYYKNEDLTKVLEENLTKTS
ncbi:MAG TPA: helix-turn-helix domain-containing protein [Pedobacter sp.]|uniref:helix-turn-helix domain-containing protein n=1 Tax=Pedobacter sp. TaxID=1411316 RepID=UPI002C73CC3E|nr:helix-turn-helix domain-containing protein [Pedobacter sp.]HMI02503.1 helix-turn-helix domain-containing protein [Pedobacter sp.]